MATRRSEPNPELIFQELRRESFTVYIMGESPLITNSMSAKAAQQLLLPPRKPTAAEKAARLKHDPYAEFVHSMNTARNEEAPTLVVVKATAPKKAIMGAALDMPGAKKAQIGRLLYVEGESSPDEVSIYGIPQMLMSVTRSADIGRTPDVRTRAIFPTWAAVLRVTYAVPLLNQRTVANLLEAAGITQGIGDWRVEKGSGSYGRFRVAPPNDMVLQLLLANGGREAQISAIENPEYYDSETEQLATWFDSEVQRRGMEKMLAGAKARAGMAA